MPAGGTSMSGTWKKDGEIHKCYPKTDLLDEDWPHRVALIERFTRALPYPTRFSDAGHSLVRSMKLVVAPAARLNAADTIQLAQLVMLVRRMHQAGIVHGDLHPKNLLWDGSRVVIIDFEPSLRQLKGYRPSLMGTAPFIHPLDVRAGRLSRLTDWMCLIHLARGLNASTCARLASETP